MANYSRILFRAFLRNVHVHTTSRWQASIHRSRNCSSLSIDTKPASEIDKWKLSLVQANPEDAELVDKKLVLMTKLRQDFRDIMQQYDQSCNWPKMQLDYIAMKSLTLDKSELIPFWDDVANAFAPFSDDEAYVYRTTKVRSQDALGWPTVTFHKLAPPAVDEKKSFFHVDVPTGERVQRARMFMDFLRGNQHYSKIASHRAVVLAYARTLMFQPENEDEAIKMVDDAMASYSLPVLDKPTADALIRFYAMTSEWRRCLAILEEIKLVDQSTSYLVYVAKLAMKNGELDLGLQLMDFEKYSADSTVFNNDLIAWAFKAAKNHDPTFFNRFLRLAQGKYLTSILKYSMATALVDFFKSEGKDVGTVTFAKIKNRKCTHCGHEMRPTKLTGAEFKQLCSAVQRVTFNRGDDLYYTSTPEELQKFKDFLRQKRKNYDVVLDGLNILHLGHPKGGLNFEFLHRVLEIFTTNYNMRILLIVRALSRKQLERISRMGIHGRIGKMIDIYNVEKTSLDDAFLVNAALEDGISTFIVSNDHLRDIRSKLAVEDRLLFMRWQMNNQIALLKYQSLKILMPYDCDLLMQEDAGGWHLPHTLPDHQYHLRPLAPSTLCIRTKEPFKESSTKSSTKSTKTET